MSERGWGGRGREGLSLEIKVEKEEEEEEEEEEEISRVDSISLLAPPWQVCKQHPA